MIYSDNIYFAKAALKIGSEEMESSLAGLGFNEELPFEIKMAESQYSNTEGIETEIQLADSGYGQGQVLVNPLHMACIYSAFCNEGNVIKPYLVYQNEAIAEYWMFDSVEAVGFQDIDGDNAKDVIVIINYVTGAGPQGMLPRKSVRIFKACDNGFIILEDMMSEIMENMDESELSISAICGYIESN